VNPFTDVVVDATFTGPSGATFSMPAFHDGGDVWRVRFNANEPGGWTFRLRSRPEDPDLSEEGSFEVEDTEYRGFLRATPGRAWGFEYESGEPVFLFGDTVYNLFGMAHCGTDMTPFLERRARQKFNLLRVRVPVSPFHPPDGYSNWQTRRTWPWGGSEQAPRFDRFDLDYFGTVDRVVREAERLGLGLEVIMEAWGFEFPFNSRQIFVPEWEELWLRYLIARYDAFNSVYFWTPLNEYEYYPNGDWNYTPIADRWALRISRWIKSVAGHGHIVSAHNGPVEPPFVERFLADPKAVDAIMFQEWGARDEKNGWLATGIEEQVTRSLDGWHGSAVLAEYGYERNPDFELRLPHHEFCDAEHTRRGAWRGAFCGLGIVHGFENSWGPWQLLEEDQPGMAYLLHLRRFLTEIVSFHELRRAPELVASGNHPSGHRPLALRSEGGGIVAVYMPVGGEASIALPLSEPYEARWFDPREGELGEAQSAATSTPGQAVLRAPAAGSDGHPPDWVLLLRARRTAS